MSEAHSKAHVPATIALCFLAALAEGFDIQSMGVAAPKMSAGLGLSREALGPVFSASIFGLLIGAALFGRIADIVGRKWTLIISLLIFAIFTLATAHAWDMQSLLTIRVLTGLGLGGAMPNLIALASECAAPGRKASTVTLITSGMPFGGAAAGAIAATLDWQGIFYVGGFFPLLLALLMIFALPESRDFLAAKTETHKANALTTLFGANRAITTLLLWIAFFFTLLVLYLLLNWLPTLMGSKGVPPQQASLISLMFNIGGGIGTILLGLLLDRGKRGLLIIASYVGMGLALAWLAIVNADVAQASAAGFIAGFFVIGAQLALYGIAPDYYAAAIRGTGVGAAIAMGRFGAVVGPLLAAALLATGGDARFVLISILPVVAIGGVAAVLLLMRPKAE